MGPRTLPDRAASPTWRRVVSAVLLAPVFLAAVYRGPPFLDVVLAAAAIAMGWEWVRLCGDRRFGASGWAVVLAVAVAGAAAWTGRFDVALLLLALGAAASCAVAAASGHVRPGWICAAPLVVGIPCMSVVWLRTVPAEGLQITVWLVGSLWATDLAAFFFGRRFGGPRLAPRISPRKTWSGLAGAVLCSALWGLVCGLWFAAGSPFLIAALGAAAAVVAQSGDLAVSSVKRRFGAKDASRLIPGHGGVLDRLDGMLTAAPALVGVVLLSNGSLLAW